MKGSRKLEMMEGMVVMERGNGKGLILITALKRGMSRHEGSEERRRGDGAI